MEVRYQPIDGIIAYHLLGVRPTRRRFAQAFSDGGLALCPLTALFVFKNRKVLEVLFGTSDVVGKIATASEKDRVRIGSAAVLWAYDQFGSPYTLGFLKGVDEEEESEEDVVREILATYEGDETDRYELGLKDGEAVWRSVSVSMLLYSPRG